MFFRQAHNKKIKKVVLLVLESGSKPVYVYIHKTRMTGVQFLEAISDRSVYLSEFGAASKMKLLSNYLVAIHNMAAGEVIALGKKMGVDKAQFGPIFSAALVGLVANGLSASFYPTDLRSTGVGWSLGFGRLGAIMGPIVGGLLVSMELTMQQLFIACAVPGLFASVAVFIMGRASSSIHLATGERSA